MNIAEPLRINARGIALRDELLLLNLTRACVDAARGERNWEWSDSDTADVLFVGADAPPTAQCDFPVQVPLLPAVVLDRGQSHILRMPVRPAAFISLLEKMQRRKLFGNAAHLTGERPIVRMTGEQRAVPAAPTPMSIDLLIDRVRGGSGTFEVRGGSSPMIVSPMIRRAWMADPDAPIALPKHFTLHELPGEAANLPGYALAMDAFLWKAAMAQQEPAAAQTWSRQGRFGLRRWPDFGRLERDPVAVKLTSLMARNQPDFAMLQRATGGNAERAVAFLNALALLDLLITGTVNATQPATSATTVRTPAVQQVQAKAAGGVFSRIRAALGLG